MRPAASDSNVASAFRDEGPAWTSPACPSSSTSSSRAPEPDTSTCCGSQPPAGAGRHLRSAHSKHLVNQSATPLRPASHYADPWFGICTREWQPPTSPDYPGYASLPENAVAASSLTPAHDAGGTTATDESPGNTFAASDQRPDAPEPMTAIATFRTDAWIREDPRRPDDFAIPTPEWRWEYALHAEYARRRSTRSTLGTTPTAASSSPPGLPGIGLPRKAVKGDTSYSLRTPDTRHAFSSGQEAEIPRRPKPASPSAGRTSATSPKAVPSPAGITDDTLPGGPTTREIVYHAPSTAATENRTTVARGEGSYADSRRDDNE